MRRSVIAGLCFAGLACAQGTEPRAKAEDYEVHEKMGYSGLGAEYMVSMFSGRGQSFQAPEHLVVEVALFPPKSEPVACHPGDFSLRVDGRLLRPVTPQTVVAAMQRAEWRYRRGVQSTIGMGNDSVILGGPPRQMPPYGGGRTPTPPRAPEPENPSGLPPAEKVRADELVVQVALPEGEFKGPVSGFLYFPFQGKASKIRTVELLFGGTTLKLK